ncbi:hypothetical protein [Chishuiella sp.]|uniref:hypothetical protein n=1 Tax=Chishuiella sp. TaxID=1969467 RepID=UPI0028B170E1|nr:hypothetical protein [Chishuiella sp.]
MVNTVNQFNQLFQLYQKGDRFNLYINDYPKGDFVRLFFSDEIENLNFSFINSITENNQFIKNNHLSTFQNYIDLVDLNSIEINEFSGYFIKYDFYFYLEGDTLVLNYIHRDFLSQLIDILLYELDCNFISRLKTELLINLEYD